MDAEDQHVTYDPRRQYWGQTPHLVNHLGLAAIDKALWLFLLEVWGMHRGMCRIGSRELAKGAGIAVGSVVAAKRNLKAAHLIDWYEEAGQPGSEPLHVIVPTDLWLTNQVAFRDRALLPGELYAGPFYEVNRAGGEHPVQQVNTPVQQVAHMKESETPPSGGVGVAPAPSAPPAPPSPAPGQETLPGIPPRRRARGAAADRPPSYAEQVKAVFRETLTDEGAMPNLKDFPEVLARLLALDPQPDLDEVREATRSLLADVGGAQQGKTTYIWFEKLPDKLKALRARRRDAPGRVGAPPVAAGSSHIDTEGFV